MNKLLFFVLCFFLAFQVKAQQGRGKHFEAGFLLGGGASVWNKIPEKNTLLVSVVVATSAGLAKESYDYNSGNKFDRLDLLSTIAGGVVGGIVAKQIKRKLNKRKKLKHAINY